MKWSRKFWMFIAEVPGFAAIMIAVVIFFIMAVNTEMFNGQVQEWLWFPGDFISIPITLWIGLWILFRRHIKKHVIQANPLEHQTAVEIDSTDAVVNFGHTLYKKPGFTYQIVKLPDAYMYSCDEDNTVSVRHSVEFQYGQSKVTLPVTITLTCNGSLSARDLTEIIAQGYNDFDEYVQWSFIEANGEQFASLELLVERYFANGMSLIKLMQQVSVTVRMPALKQDLDNVTNVEVHTAEPSVSAQTYC